METAARSVKDYVKAEEISLHPTPFVPSPTGLGIAMVVPDSNGLAMFLGGALAETARRNWRRLADLFVTPIASGFIASESSMGITVSVAERGQRVWARLERNASACARRVRVIVVAESRDTTSRAHEEPGCDS